jgi:DNA-binding transcriptional MerR regulator
MTKSPEAFRTISEVADTLDVPPHVLRFWETRFAQVKPVKRGGGRRYYRPEDVRLLRGIRGLLYEEGMTIKGVQKILRERGVRHVIGLGTSPDGEEAAPAPPPLAKPARTAPAAGEPIAEPIRREPMGTGVPHLRAVPAAQDAQAAGGAAPGAAAEVAEIAPAPGRREALRRILSELQELRAVMTGEAGA